MRLKFEQIRMFCIMKVPVFRSSDLDCPEIFYISRAVGIFFHQYTAHMIIGIIAKSSSGQSTKIFVLELRQHRQLQQHPQQAQRLQRRRQLLLLQQQPPLIYNRIVWNFQFIFLTFQEESQTLISNPIKCPAIYKHEMIPKEFVK